MNIIDAAYEVLRQANEPLHYREIRRRALDQGLWQSNGATPEALKTASFHQLGELPEPQFTHRFY